MATRPFDTLVSGPDPLLPAAERLVVEAHRHWYESTGRQDWSEPKAYHWLHYEDPDHLTRLKEGIKRIGPSISLDAAQLSKLEQRVNSD
jgi:hypothetical protein